MAPRRRPRRFPVCDAALADFAVSMRDNLLSAAQDGDVPLLKRTVRMLDEEVLPPTEFVEGARGDQGIWALTVAAGNGRMEVCRYLLQVLRVDVNAADHKGHTPLFHAVHKQRNEYADVVKCLLDRGADPDTASEGGISPLHCAAGNGPLFLNKYLCTLYFGDYKIIELLLAKGAYVDPIADNMGTPLVLATRLKKVGVVKILLEHNADPNKPFMTEDDVPFPMTPLLQAVNASSVECAKLLVEAGAVVTSDCLTAISLGPTMENDSAIECLDFLMEAYARRDAPNDDKHVNAWKIKQLKSFGSQAVQRKDYFSACLFYTKAIDIDPSDATLFSNRSICSLRQGDGQAASLDALKCRELRPDWAKEYESASQAFSDGLELDPESAERACITGSHGIAEEM
ncbi:unnamed protein product [Alopecurus aequalis]